MAQVHGKPFLDILFSQLDECGLIDGVALALGYKASKIIDKYKSVFPYRFSLDFCVEKKLLGTGGAVKNAIGHTKSNPVLVMNGDSYTDIDLKDFIRFHKKHKAKLTIALFRKNGSGRYGSIQVDARGKIVSFQEKIKTNKNALINAGLYLMDRGIFDNVRNGKILSLEKDLMPSFVTRFKNSVFGYLAKGRFIDIGTPRSYVSADKYLR